MREPQVQHPFKGHIYVLAAHARQSLTPLETRFWREAKSQWPKVHWRRYAPVVINPFADAGPSTWYAPFLNIPKKLIVVIDDRPDFPYRIYGQNTKLYARQGYRILDFSEDFSCPADESVWQQAMQTIEAECN